MATSSTTPITTPVLTASGAVTIYGYVIDSRGRQSASAFASITVQPYAPPTLTASAERCLSGGTIDADGTYLSALAAFGCSSVGGNNTTSCAVQYRKVGAETWTDGGTLTSGTAAVLGAGGIAQTDDYEVLFTATDALSGVSTYTADVSRSFRLLNASGSLGSVAVGRMASMADAFQCALDAEFEGDLNVTGTIMQNGSDLASALQAQLVNLIYPVDSILMSTNSANPATYLGVGTWVAWGQGRVPVGVGTGTDDNSASQTFAADATGGEYAHTLATSEMPSHNHGFLTQTNYLSNGGWTSAYGVTRSPVSAYTLDLATYNAGGGGSHNNIPPYATCYMWKRTV